MWVQRFGSNHPVVRLGRRLRSSVRRLMWRAYHLRSWVSRLRPPTFLESSEAEVHLGCGSTRIPGFIKIDVRPTPASDIVEDCVRLHEQLYKSPLDAEPMKGLVRAAGFRSGLVFRACWGGEANAATLGSASWKADDVTVRGVRQLPVPGVANIDWATVGIIRCS